MSAGIYNISLEQGATFTITVTLTDGATPAVPIDLTGYTGRGQIRLNATDTTALADFTVTVLTPEEDGKVEITLSATDTEAIVTTGLNYTEVLEAQYDVELVNGDEVIRLLNGACYISPEITKDV